MKILIYGVKKEARFPNHFINVTLPKLKFPVEVYVSGNMFDTPVEWLEHTNGLFTADKFYTISTDYKYLKYLL
jgi:hypothetical protein